MVSSDMCDKAEACNVDLYGGEILQASKLEIFHVSIRSSRIWLIRLRTGQTRTGEATQVCKYLPS